MKSARIKLLCLALLPTAVSASSEAASEALSALKASALGFQFRGAGSTAPFLVKSKKAFGEVPLGIDAQLSYRCSKAVDVLAQLSPRYINNGKHTGHQVFGLVGGRYFDEAVGLSLRTYVGGVWANEMEKKGLGVFSQGLVGADATGANWSLRLIGYYGFGHQKATRGGVERNETVGRYVELSGDYQYTPSLSVEGAIMATLGKNLAYSNRNNEAYDTALVKGLGHLGQVGGYIGGKWMPVALLNVQGGVKIGAGFKVEPVIKLKLNYILGRSLNSLCKSSAVKNIRHFNRDRMDWVEHRDVLLFAVPEKVVIQGGGA